MIRCTSGNGCVRCTSCLPINRLIYTDPPGLFIPVCCIRFTSVYPFYIDLLVLVFPKRDLRFVWISRASLLHVSQPSYMIENIILTFNDSCVRAPDVSLNVGESKNARLDCVVYCYLMECVWEPWCIYRGCLLRMNQLIISEKCIFSRSERKQNISTTCKV